MAPPILFMKCVSCGKRLVCVSSKDSPPVCYRVRVYRCPGCFKEVKSVELPFDGVVPSSWSEYYSELSSRYWKEMYQSERRFRKVLEERVDEFLSSAFSSQRTN